VELRQCYPDWGARELRVLLQREGLELGRKVERFHGELQRTGGDARLSTERVLLTADSCSWKNPRKEATMVAATKRSHGGSQPSSEAQSQACEP
jgi:hypothetical protein